MATIGSMSLKYLVEGNGVLENSTLVTNDSVLLAIRNTPDYKWEAAFNHAESTGDDISNLTESNDDCIGRMFEYTKEFFEHCDPETTTINDLFGVVEEQMNTSFLNEERTSIRRLLYELVNRQAN